MDAGLPGERVHRHERSPEGLQVSEADSLYAFWPIVVVLLRLQDRRALTNT